MFIKQLLETFQVLSLDMARLLVGTCCCRSELRVLPATEDWHRPYNPVSAIVRNERIYSIIGELRTQTPVRR